MDSIKLTMPREFAAWMPDDNGEFGGHDLAVGLGAGEYEILGVTGGYLIIADGSIDEGEGCNWILDFDRLDG